MATASVLSPMAIPGLGYVPTPGDLEDSARAYNALPDDRDQPDVEAAVLTGLKDLLIEHKAWGKFGYHLVHGHLKVRPGQVMFGKAMADLQGCWTRPTDINQLDRENMHGHIFALGLDHKFTAYEYREGPGSQMTEADNAFVAATQKYLIAHGLETLLGIEVLNGDPANDLQEFVLSDGQGTVMLDANFTKVKKSYRVTGWGAVTNEATGILELKGGQSHSATTKGTHQVFWDGKGLPDMPDDEEAGVSNALRKEGVIE